jgi:carboxymethylenebutenolidase
MSSDPSPDVLVDTWEAHTTAEFVQHDADATIATMTDDPALLHVPVGTGAAGREPLRRFYGEVFLPNLPPDWATQMLHRSVAHDHVIDEFILRFTHTIPMDWLAPGVPATGRSVVVPTVAVVAFVGDKIASEHIYWDHASLLVQLGVLDRALPVLGAEEADRLLDVHAPANELISRFASPSS